MSADPTAHWDAIRWSIYQRVRAFVADAADVPLERVSPQSDIFEELGVDSLGLALILVNLEEEFQVQEPDNVREIGPSLNTPAAIVEFALDTARAR